MSPSVLILPGYGNSGPLHWQSVWEAAHPEFHRVQQADWDHPVREDWVAKLEAAVAAAGPEVVLVAHSMGCLTLAHWAGGAHSPVKAAMLVAVPDPDGPGFPTTARGFQAPPARPFGFPSIVVTSDNDPYGSRTFAERLAAAWGSRCINVGMQGHINADSGLGDWPDGFALLQALRT